MSSQSRVITFFSVTIFDYLWGENVLCAEIWRVFGPTIKIHFTKDSLDNRLGINYRVFVLDMKWSSLLFSRVYETCLECVCQEMKHSLCYSRLFMIL